MRYAISDIHGCAATLRYAVQELDLQPEDRLYFLGDYVDRGPDSLGVIRYIQELDRAGQVAAILRGNHEQIILNCAAGECDLYDWYPEQQDEREVLQWMDGLAYYHETPGYILVHAGLNFNATDPLLDKNAMLWERYWYDDIRREWLNGRVIVHGHTPQKTSETEEQLRYLHRVPAVCIDTGCAYDSVGKRKLTVLNLDTQRARFFDRLDSVT